LPESRLKRGRGKDSSSLIPGTVACSTDRRAPVCRSAVLSIRSKHLVRRLAFSARPIDWLSALAVVDAHASRLSVVALAAGDNAEFAEQIQRYRPRVAALAPLKP
jgi:hypothetical protein